jgi:Uncharacterised nucleotidyltransferase
MTKRGFRFRPPEIAFGPELRWVLLRGFGPPEAEILYSVEPEAACALAAALDLGPRIGTRVRPERLQREVGPDAARQFLIASATAEAHGKRLVLLAHRVATVAADVGVPLVFLKFAAIHFSGALAGGSRSAADLDVMVAPGDLERLANALRMRNFATSGLPDSDQHVAPFVDASGAIVEIHRYLQGVSLGRKGAFASVGELTALGSLVPVSQLPGDCSIPTREVTAAHIIAHGVAHHGRKPQEYPLFRMVADLIDLGFASEDGEALLERVTPWVKREVSSEEARAVHDLCARLSAGDEGLFTRAAQIEPEALVLRHLVAGSTDQAYAESLQVSAFLGRVSHLPRPVALARAIWHALFLNRAQVDKIYGKQSSWAGYLRRQALRPFDLLAQAAHSLVERAWMRSGPKA